MEPVKTKGYVSQKIELIVDKILIYSLPSPSCPVNDPLFSNIGKEIAIIRMATAIIKKSQTNEVPQNVIVFTPVISCNCLELDNRSSVGNTE